MCCAPEARGMLASFRSSLYHCRLPSYGTPADQLQLTTDPSPSWVTERPAALLPRPLDGKIKLPGSSPNFEGHLAVCSPVPPPIFTVLWRIFGPAPDPVIALSTHPRHLARCPGASAGLPCLPGIGLRRRFSKLSDRHQNLWAA